MANRPVPEVALDADLARRLLSDQHRELAELPIAVLSRGWDNTNFRLGDELILRMPHRQVADQLIVNEQRWLPRIDQLVDLAIPAPTHVGSPTSEYPWHWSVTPWFEGTEAARAPLQDPAVSADVLGRFFAQLHVPAPNDAPSNEFRGGPLRDRAESFATRLQALSTTFDTDAFSAVFDAACEAEDSTKRVWLHADLHTRNMVVHHGKLVAVIDWGDICSGDPATDLAAAFMLVPNDIATVQDHAGASEADWQRARGWAMHFAVVYLVHSDDDPVMYEIGTRLVDTLVRG